MIPGRAAVVGLGLIGGSVGMALGNRGWEVLGIDVDAERRVEAVRVGAVDTTADRLSAAAGADVVVVATPVGVIAAVAREVLAAGASLVTDVGSVKGPVVAAVDHPRFVGGHPMAGSEQEGLAGARPDMFSSAVWVLTPGPATDDDAFGDIRALVASLDADVLTLPPDDHDAVVAVVSHVPHLAAVTLMQLADGRATEHRALLRLAAGGFRDMTRIAAGHPGIWPDICVENRQAITGALDELIGSLTEVRGLVDAADRAALLTQLEAARRARLNLPSGVPRDIELGELRVPILDRPGELARLTALATEIDVNIYDLEIAHSTEGNQGVVIMVVPLSLGERFVGALMAGGYRPVLQALEPPT